MWPVEEIGDSLHVLMGAWTWRDTTALYSITSVLGVPQIVYSVTRGLLEGRAHPSLIRTCFSQQVQLALQRDLFDTLKWKHVAVIGTNPAHCDLPPPHTTTHTLAHHTEPHHYVQARKTG
jgi:hypothetical protein